MVRGFRVSVACIVALMLSGVASSQDLGASQQHWKRHEIDATSLGADGVRTDDVNGDGLADLVTSWEQGGVARAYVMSRGAVSLPSWETVTVGKAPDGEDALFFDADGDGVLDVVSSTEGETRRILVHWAPRSTSEYLDDSKWNTETLYSNGSRWMFAIPIELDQRRGRGLVVGGKDRGAKVGWLERPSDPRETTQWRFHEISATGWIMSLIAEDMDADGDSDILLSDRRGDLAGIRWLENPGMDSEAVREAWRNHWIGARGREAMLIAFHDFDGDGVKEVVAPHYKMDDWQLSIFRAGSSPAENATSWQDYPLPYPGIAGRPKSAAVGDIDLDGQSDIVLATAQAYGEKRGIVWMQYKKSPFGGEWDAFDVSGPDGRKFDLSLLLDVDGDGDLDIINTEEHDNAAGGHAGLGVVWYENPVRQRQASASVQ